MSDLAIQVENLSKRYRIGLRETQHETLVGSAVSWLKSPLNNFRRLRSLSAFDDDEAEDVIWALRDVNFEVKQGEVVGIIGRNGAGKSTLLKVLSRITPPTRGRVVLNGRVASLLEVGTGFHPELTGRENIYLNGTILGMSKAEIDRKFDEIIDFSGVKKFIDTPVKHYSSGMRVRLAFSVAAYLEPEILLIDEVLSVGDADFQRKSLDRMGKLAKGGRTVLFVSHNMGAIMSLCDRVYLLDAGSLVFMEDAMEAVKQYLGNTERLSAVWKVSNDTISNGNADLKSIIVRGSDGNIKSEFLSYEPIFIEMEVRLERELSDLKIGFELSTEYGDVAFTSFHNDIPTWIDHLGANISKGTLRFIARIPGELLNEHVYYVTAKGGIHRKQWLFEESRAVRFKVYFKNRNNELIVRKRPGIISPLIDWEVNLLP